MSLGTRLFGVGGVALIALLILGGALLTWRTCTAPAPATFSVFDVAPSISPPEISPQEKEVPKPVEKKPPEPQPARPLEPTIVPIAQVSQPMPVAAAQPADPPPRVPEAATPKAAPAPPAPAVASNGSDTWEGRVLAQLNRHRQYPRSAIARRQQGISYIRFVIDRDGKVLSSRLERSSGFPNLDREAVALAKRASPLPKPPDEKRGETIELIVPVEFFLSAR